MNIIKKSFSTFTARITAFLITIIINIIIARVLGPSGKGIWAALLFIPTMTYTLFNLGIEESNVYFTSSKKYNQKKIINYSLLIALVVSLIVFIIYFSGYDIIYRFMSLRYEKLNHHQLILTMSAIPFVFIFNYLSGYIQGMGEIYTANKLSVLSQFITLIGISIAFFVFKAGLTGLVCVYLGVRILVTGVIGLMVRIKTGKIPLRAEKNTGISYLKDNLGYGLKSYLAGSTEILNYRIDFILIYTFLGASFLGIYTVAVAVSEIIWFASRSIAFPLFPGISSSVDKDSEKMVHSAGRLTFYSSMVLSIILMISIHILIPLFFGKEFSSAVYVAYILIPGIFLSSPSRAIMTYFKATGTPQVNTRVNTITLIINIFLNILLIPRSGIKGAAIASVISYIANYLIYLFIYCKKTGNSPVKFYYKRNK